MYKRILAAAAVLSLIYWGMLLASSGLDVWFNHCWLLLGLFLLAASRVSSIKAKRIISAILIAGILIAGAGTLQLINAANQEPQPDADYCLILGAKVDPDSTPSLLLYYRLAAAMDYCTEYKDTEIIVSGGQGDNEPVSEAECMKNWLVKHGIDSSRIIMENNSTSTSENISLSKKLMKSPSSDTVLVTNSFHVFRALKLCEANGLTNVTGLGADTMKMLAPNYYLRELAALFKDLVL